MKTTMRQITEHKINGLNEDINVFAVDVPGPGGANHQYRLSYRESTCRAPFRAGVTGLTFQKGPVNAEGVNGLSNEALLAVVIDRLRGFQHARKPDGTFDFTTRGYFACEENAGALTHLEEALTWLQKRTRDRVARGVEGTPAA